MKLTVIIPTFNRPEKLNHTVDCLRKQSVAADDYEIIVVDNGSVEPVHIVPYKGGPACRLIRFEQNQERAIARNTAAEAAKGELLLFSDDDLGTEIDFLAAHLRAHSEWPDSMVVGRIVLPPEFLANPGVSFRQKLELASVPDSRGPVNIPNFGTAANMSILKDRYLTLGGFDQQMVGIEDQDFSIRYTTSGGRIIYLPEAVAVHYDDWLDFEGFCRRQEWASECTVRLRNRYPDMADGALRQAVNGPIRFLREPILHTARKALKSAVAVGSGRIVLFKGIATLERRAPESGLLSQMYKLALGAHLLKGYRKGLLKYGSNDSSAPAPPSKARKPQSSAV